MSVVVFRQNYLNNIGLINNSTNIIDLINNFTDSKLFTPKDTFTVIKPANVLLFPSKTFGEQWDLKLADFGLSKEPGTDSSRVSGSSDVWWLSKEDGRLLRHGGFPDLCLQWPMTSLRKWMEVQPSRRATAAELLKHLFVAPHRLVRSVIPLCPDQMHCPPAVIRYARRQGGPMMMMMTMAPPRPGDLIC
ncbi:hypothetical protein F2Q68_00032328 [Brassica cretica]|uniref:Protein kinase domain-containing protein n=1 Tax=Brassica cretica TaxID=69181 RepID=A0A8S9GCX9_BRACR|nr:hypothetical protein F2Q68_00032328 [Brassica cretica]